MAPAVIPISFIIYLDRTVLSWEAVPVMKLGHHETVSNYYSQGFIHIFFSSQKVIIRNSRCIVCVCRFDRKQLSCCALSVWKTEVLSMWDLNSLTFNLLSLHTHAHAHPHPHPHQEKSIQYITTATSPSLTEFHLNLLSPHHDFKWIKIILQQRRKTERKNYWKDKQM